MTRQEVIDFIKNNLILPKSICGLNFRIILFFGTVKIKSGLPLLWILKKAGSVWKTKAKLILST